MSTRLLATFLAFVVLWTGFAGWEWEPSIAGTAEVVAMPGSTIDDGSVSDHHLDDQPVQSPSDLGGGLLALLPSHELAVLVGTDAGPPSAAHRLPDAPFLEGLRRPPRLA